MSSHLHRFLTFWLFSFHFISDPLPVVLGQKVPDPTGSWSSTLHPTTYRYPSFCNFYFNFRARVAIPEVLRWTRGIRHVLGCCSKLAGKTGPTARLGDDGQSRWVASFTHPKPGEGNSVLAECYMQLRKWDNSYNFLIMLVSKIVDSVHCCRSGLVLDPTQIRVRILPLKAKAPLGL